MFKRLRNVTTDLDICKLAIKSNMLKKGNNESWSDTIIFNNDWFIQNSSCFFIQTHSNLVQKNTAVSAGLQAASKKLHSFDVDEFGELAYEDSSMLCNQLGGAGLLYLKSEAEFSYLAALKTFIEKKIGNLNISTPYLDYHIGLEFHNATKSKTLNRLYSI